ncbi:hypothetical protein DND132_1948 [Pseudodesulfovibrio mercurii]|uniref:B30.2/SPRY domain-containing protein n=1 Tax=Pseudodesulfovibrio mercurii TaxID=641491 RepID=F0JGW4_9BACT|nr:right-handed parallel beta-helix repeat-containing protein [Pseudodesulfovibrio mercurii]EGB15154.1 hypothetical protein DND132_1948 [Pseudodesulfovibrio mercurii]
MATITTTIKPAGGGDYTSLAAWDYAEAANLVGAGNTHVAECYGGGNLGPVTLSSWTTDAANRLVIQAADGERHMGVYDEAYAYASDSGNLLLADQAGLGCLDIIGLQFNKTGGSYSNGIYLRSTSTYIDKCIFKGPGGDSTGVCGINGSQDTATPSFIVTNTIFYDFTASSNAYTAGIRTQTVSDATLYNCTFINCRYGLRADSGTPLVKNCIFRSAPITGTLDAASGNNSTSTGIVFADYDNDDFALDATDTVARDTGADLAADGTWAFSDDILGAVRESGNWDIGAFEYVAPGGNNDAVVTLDVADVVVALTADANAPNAAVVTSGVEGIDMSVTAWLIAQGLAVHTLLDFSDAADLGHDASGNGHDWTLTGARQSVDTPTSNHATLNPIRGFVGSTTGTLSDGNLTFRCYPSEVNRSVFGTATADFPFYFEVGDPNLGIVYKTFGVASAAASGQEYGYVVGNFAGSWGFRVQSASSFLKYAEGVGGTDTGYAGPFAAGDVFGVAVDPSAGKMWVRHNGAWILGGNPATGENPTLTFAPQSVVPGVGEYNGGYVSVDFGQHGYAYAPPDGFLPLCDASRPEPAVLDTSAHVLVTTFTAPAGAPRAITVGWDAEHTDWGLRLKNLDADENWRYISTVAGLGYSNDAYASASGAPRVALTTPLSASGGVITIPADLLTDGDTYAVEVLRVGPKSGFDIVTYTGTGAVRTVVHGLGSAPFAVLIMPNDATAHPWVFNTDALGWGTSLAALATDAATTSATCWNDTAPTDVGVTVATDAALNASGDAYQMWVWADAGVYREIDYTGSGTTGAGGAVAHLGGTPEAVLFLKDAAGAYHWPVHWAVRSASNPVDEYVNSDVYSAEAADDKMDFLSNGFKIIQSVTNGYNVGGHRHVGIAVAGNEKYRNGY